MKLKSIYTKNGLLVHEYFVDLNDKEILIEKMGLDDKNASKLEDLLSDTGNEGSILIENNMGCTLILKGVCFIPSSLEDTLYEDNTPIETPIVSKKEYKPYTKNKKYGFKK